MVGPFIFGVVAYYLSLSSSGQHDPDFTNLLLYVLAGLLLTCFVSANLIFKFLLSRIDGTAELKRKMPKYFLALLIRSGLLELPGLFAVVITFITGNTLPLVGLLIVLITFYLLRPTQSQISLDLNLSPSERAILNDPSGIIAETVN